MIYAICVTRSVGWKISQAIARSKNNIYINNSFTMAQRSITSFFGKASESLLQKNVDKQQTECQKSDVQNGEFTNGQAIKRQRSSSGDKVIPKSKLEKSSKTIKVKKTPKKETKINLKFNVKDIDKTETSNNENYESKRESPKEKNKKVAKTPNKNMNAKKTPKKQNKKIDKIAEDDQLDTPAKESSVKVEENLEINEEANKELSVKVKQGESDPEKQEVALDVKQEKNYKVKEEESQEVIQEEVRKVKNKLSQEVKEGQNEKDNENFVKQEKNEEKLKLGNESINQSQDKDNSFNDISPKFKKEKKKITDSDDDSPIKAKKRSRISRVSSSSSEDATDNSQTETEKQKSPPKTTAINTFFTKKQPTTDSSEKKRKKEKDIPKPCDKQPQKNWLITANKTSTEVVGADYNPSKSKYNPVDDACWAKGVAVPYLALARTLEVIENTSARLKIVDLLSNYFRSVILLTPEDLLPSVYLCLNKLAPAYESVELGIAETYLMKAIAQATGRKLGQVKTLVEAAGDLGLAAEKARGAQMIMVQPPPLTIRSVIKGLREIAKMTGQASITKKINKIQTMFVACRHSEARYFIRSLAGKLRIGLAEQSVLQALAQAVSYTPPKQDILDASKGTASDAFKSTVDANALIIKTTYCELPNYDVIIPTLLEHGVAALPDKCKLTPGVPLKPMLAHPTKGVHEIFQRFDGCHFTCEWKYDGERAQIHVPEKDGKADLKQAKIFSRNQEDNTTKYPDVLSRLQATLGGDVASCVLDCEAVAWDPENEKILPFQILSTRKRKDANISEIKVHVCLFMFDLLYLNGKSLVAEPLELRRQLLHDNFKENKGEWLYATSRDCSTIDEVQEFLDESVKGSCEGLMVKTLSGKDATYQIAKRSKNWLKLKKDYLDGVGDTIDAVVIGGYKGRGKRAGVYGGFLLACYDPDSEEYQSLCKIGTGFSDEDLQNHAETLKAHITDGPRTYYRYDQSHSPDEWFTPSVVWEIRCADLSISPAHFAAMGHIQPDKGISLRFPRFVRIRDDKTPEEATSASQIARIYLSQDQVKNNATTSKDNADDDFY